MNALKKLLLLLLGLSSSINGVCGTIDPEVPDENYTNYAQDFHYIAELKGILNSGDLYIASAVAIDDHRILTAAHIIEDSKRCVAILDKKPFAIDRFVYPKKFSRQSAGKSDIAIGYSKKSFGLSFYPELYTEKDEVGKLCCISGYGRTGTFITGAKYSDRKKRAGSNIIDSIYEDILICTPSQPKSPMRTSLEFIIADGDSGGGLFIDGKLAGINSCVLSTDQKPDSTYGDESCHTRVSNFIDWIHENK